jgi:GNAT superfamily N-acetyltransferase
MSDISILVELMSEVYAEAGYELDRVHAGAAFATLLGDERLGWSWLIETEGRDVGHIVVTLRFGMEYGGLIACLDDLYVKPEWRNRGLSRVALAEVREFCATAGVRAMTVEVAFDNGPAQAVYRRTGFAEPPNRQLLALALAPASHVS